MPMFGTVLRQLLDRKVTTLKEIEEATGRGTSTIYRWMRGESEPTATDVRLSIRHLNPKARNELVSVLSADLPVIIKWVDTEEQLREEFEMRRPMDGHDVVDMTLMALDTVAHLLNSQRESIRNETELSLETYGELSNMMDTSIRYLTTARVMMDKYIKRRKKARPLEG